MSRAKVLSAPAKAKDTREGSPYEHDRVCEIDLGVEMAVGIERLERRVRADQREAAFVHGFRQSDKFETRRRCLERWRRERTSPIFSSPRKIGALDAPFGETNSAASRSVDRR